MKRKILFRRVVLFFIILLIFPIPSFASEAGIANEKHISIATLDDRPVSMDRLLFMACKNINYTANFTCLPLQLGYDSANSGEKDGVISSQPDVEDTYSNLIKVPVPLEQANMYAFARPDSDIEVNSWEDLKGLSIALLPGRLYALTQIPASTTINIRENSKSVLDDLVRGEYDVALLAERMHEIVTPRTDVVKAGLLYSLPEYLYINKDKAHIIPALTNELNAMFERDIAVNILNDIPLPEINQKQTILHIISSNKEISNEEKFSNVISKRFETDMNVEWYNITLDSRRFSGDTSRLSFIANLLRQDIVSRDIVAIIVSGDTALEFLTSYYYLHFRNIPVLFYGVSEQYETILQGYEKYFAGIVVSLEAYETVNAALSLFPNTKKLYVLNDYSSEGVQYRKTIENQLKPLENVIDIEYNENLACDTILDNIRALPQDSVVLVGSYFVDADGQYYTLNEMQRFLERDCDVPIFSVYSTDVEYNSIGGKSLDYSLYAEVISDMLKEVKNGVSSANIPIITNSEQYNRWVFDKIKLDLFGIEESSLPEGSYIINKKLPIWESDRRFAITVALLFALSVIVVINASIIFTRWRRRKEEIINESKIRAVKERLERIINTSPVLFVIIKNGIVTELNENTSLETGLRVGDHILKLYHDLDDRNKLLDEVMSSGLVKNEIIKVIFADGKVHRCLVNAATVDYDGDTSVVFWANDIEQSEMQKDQVHTMQRSLQTALDIMPVAVRIVSRKDFTITYANNAALKMFGYTSRDEIYGRNIIDMAVPNQSNGVSAAEKINRQLNLTETDTIEIEYFDSKGGIVDTRITTCNIEYNGIDSALSTLTDLAKEREAQKIRESLQMVLDFLPVPIRIVNLEDHTITYANEAVANLFKASSPKDAYGISIFDFMPDMQPDGTPTEDKIKRLNLSSEPTSMELQCIKMDNEPFETRITDCLIDFRGKKSSLGVLEDLTAEKNYQRMLASTAEKEREANLLKGRFLVNMSHEIRTPMNAIIGLTEIELRKNCPKDIKEIYKKINISAKNLLEIINDILDLSKIEADKIELFEDEFELEEVMNSALLVASPRLDGKNVEFMFNESLDLPRYLIGDRTRLWQILKNFLDNSAKYTENGKIALTVFADNEKSDDENITITFIIEDTGIGMDEHQMQRIFRPYEQIYNDAQKKYTGTGLGMAISKQLCELMGGQLQVESRLGEGTAVHLSIPFKRSPNKETERQAVNASVLSGMNILAVDDDKLSLDIMENLLKSNDVNYTMARSGMEAMEIILERRSKGYFFDIILLDYMMDGLNGLETAKQIHLSLSKAPKLLMVTSYQKLLLKSELDKYGIDDIIEKPFIPSHFIKKLCSALGYESGVEEGAVEAYTRFKGVTALLCEDYKLNQEIAVGMFSQFGVEAVIAEDGKQGVEILNGGQKFDLIFMDLQMPVMDGYEATRIIRADPRFDDTPIISLTADAMTDIVEKCIKMGMNDHVAKPIEFDNLHRIFKKWLPESKRVTDEKAPDFDGISMNTALARFGGDKNRYEKALGEFSQMLPDNWRKFGEVLKSREESGKFIHKLKGAAGNLGENDIYDCTVEFEKSLRGADPDEALYERLVAVCNAAKARIAERTESTEEGSLEIGTPDELAELFDGLKDSLAGYDPKTSVTLINLLKEKSWPFVDERRLEELYELSLKYEFDAAYDILEQLMGDKK